jgi:probable phosphoglycerate mutase
MDLVLVRHARPVRIDTGLAPADPELTELGHRQAKAMAAWLAEEAFDAIYVSPMVRARQTAEPLEQMLGIRAEVVDAVQEYDAMENHYIPMEDLKADKSEWRTFVAEQATKDMSDFADLVNGALETMIGDHRGQRVAVVCHGGVINVWAARVLGTSSRMFFEPHYTSIHRFVAASSGERSVLSLNEVGHLRGLE